MSRWKKIIEEDDDDEIVIQHDEQQVINPLCKGCAERVDGSMTTRKDVLCIYGLIPERVDEPKEGMGGTDYKCRKFNPISDINVT